MSFFFLSFSRYNFQKLVEFVKPAQAQIIKEYPHLRATFVSVADMRIVPDNMKSMVEPVLKKKEAKDRAMMVDEYHANTDTGFMGLDSVSKGPAVGVGVGGVMGQYMLVCGYWGCMPYRPGRRLLGKRMRSATQWTPGRLDVAIAALLYCTPLRTSRDAPD